MTNQSVNIEAIKTASNKTKARMALMEIWSERKRGRFEQSLPRAMRLLKDKGVQYDTSDIQSFFKELQTAGAGAIVGSKDYPRFVFNAHLISIVNAAGFETKSAVKKLSEKLLPVTPMRSRRPELPKIELAALDMAAPMPAPTQVKAATPVKVAAPTTTKTVKLTTNGITIEMALNMDPNERDVVLGILKCLA